MQSENASKKGLPPVAVAILSYKNESEMAKRKRMEKNQDNFSCYHLEQNYSHKIAGQSKEFLPKQAMAVEQISSFVQQGLMDHGEWFRIEDEFGVKDPLIKSSEIQSLVARQLENINKGNTESPQGFAPFTNDALKAGLLASVMIMKVDGEYVPKHTFETKETTFLERLKNRKLGQKKLLKKEKMQWQLRLSLVRPEDYFPDPTGRGLYRIQQIEMDHHKLVAMAERNPEDWDLEAVKDAKGTRDDMQRARQATETGQSLDGTSSRLLATILEFWGDLIDPSTGQVIMENCRAVIDISGRVLMPPKPNDNWHGETPYEVIPIIRAPWSVWHKALMDAPTKLNRALNEIYNLMFDGGMASVHGVRQLRTNWLANPEEVSNGIPWGKTLRVNSQCPPMGKVMERVDTGSLDEEALQMYNLGDREFMQSALVNDTRMGSMAQRAVKATEIVAANNTINGVFNGIVKNIESGVARVIRKSWLTAAQHMNDLDEQEVRDIIGEDRARAIATLTPEDRFAATASGRKFSVFGLSQTVNKMQDYRKITTLLQTIAGSQELIMQFKKKYSFSKLLGEIIWSIDIDKKKIELSPEEMQQAQAENQQMMQMMAAEKAKQQQKAGAGGGEPDMQSQIPQAGSERQGSDMSDPRAMVNQGITG